MKVEEINIVFNEANPTTPMLLYRAGRSYYLHNGSDIDMPIRRIGKEQAWDLLGITEAMREILRQTL